MLWAKACAKDLGIHRILELERANMLLKLRYLVQQFTNPLHPPEASSAQLGIEKGKRIIAVAKLHMFFGFGCWRIVLFDLKRRVDKRAGRCHRAFYRLLLGCFCFLGFGGNRRLLQTLWSHESQTDSSSAHT